MVTKRSLNTKKKFALVSTYNKIDLSIICTTFQKFNIQIISTGSTGEKIKSLGFDCINVSDLTKFKEILDGRVKTLNPQIHASLLFDRQNKKHSSTFKRINFPQIDFVIVNLYPFEEAVINKKNKNIIEMIDIGGPALLRSAGKNFNSVTAISSSSDYKSFGKEMDKGNGQTSINFRKKMALKVFLLTSKYDNSISSWLDKSSKKDLIISNHKIINLKYGENPNQKAKIYIDKKSNNFYNNKLSGKELSYNNVLDVDAALNCLSEFSEPTCIIVKHSNPCGVASNSNIIKAFRSAYKCDPVSSFGGILAVNRIVDIDFAKNVSSLFFEIIIAKDFKKNALRILTKKKKLIIINLKNLKLNKTTDEVRSINNGYVVQEKNIKKIKLTKIIQASNYKASTIIKNDLIFALKVCKHVKSNAIVLCNNNKTIGIGAGQMSRIDSCKIALGKINKNSNFVAASDAFFPFTDSLKVLIKKNCKAVIQPYGSRNDHKIAKYANQNKLPLYFYDNRFFKH